MLIDYDNINKSIISICTPHFYIFFPIIQKLLILFQILDRIKHQQEIQEIIRVKNFGDKTEIKKMWPYFVFVL